MSAPKNQPRKPCYCPKCNGIPVTRQTIWSHTRKHGSDTSDPSFPQRSLHQSASSSVHGYFQHLQNQPDAVESENESSSGGDSDNGEPGYGIGGSMGQQSAQYNKRSDHVPVDIEMEDVFQRSKSPSPHDHQDNVRMSDAREESQMNEQREQLPTVPERDGVEADDDAHDETLRNMARLAASADGSRSDAPEQTDDEDDQLSPESVLSAVEAIRITQQYIDLIAKATLDDESVDPDLRDRLRNPLEGPVDISDPDVRLSLDLFLANTNSPEEAYEANCKAIRRRYPDTHVLSLHLVKKLVSDITGIVAVYDDMCKNSCLAFNGPFADQTSCPVCGEPRYNPEAPNKKVPQLQFVTFLLAPQVQALFRSKESARELKYYHAKLREVMDHQSDTVYDDIFCGSEFVELSERLNLTEHDVLFSQSIDGIQLYQNKKSDTWMGIYKVENFKPSLRFKQKCIFPPFVIPGPNKPKHIEPFLLPALAHISACQKENNGKGVVMWDQDAAGRFYSRLIACLELADALGLVEVNGRVGHHGVKGCRLGCPMKGRHKPGTGHYYAVHMKPNNSYTVSDCTHEDFAIRNIPKITITQYEADLAQLVASNTSTYEKNRKETGLTKPCILSGLSARHMIPVPMCFTIDLMHLLSLNFGDLFIPLWRGSFKCEDTDQKKDWTWATLNGDNWKEFGQLVIGARRHFPSSFHRPPRNPVEKISSGYKSTEYFLLLIGLGPGHLRPFLPNQFWRSYCRFVRAVRIFLQRSITSAQIREAHKHAVLFVEEYELLYYQKRPDRLHFCRPSVHTLLHLASEVVRVGPGAYSTQFTIERYFGEITKQVRQPSNPFANLSQRAERRAQTNALRHLYPELDPSSTPRIPRGAKELDGGFLLLRPRSEYTLKIPSCSTEEQAYMDAEVPLVHNRVTKWGRLRLPNGQIARSLWCESRMRRTELRISRNVKALIDGKIEYCEVQYYFLRAMYPEEPSRLSPYALVSIFSAPDEELLRESHQTLWACQYRGQDKLRIISTGDIISVVSMQPLPPVQGDFVRNDRNLCFVVEKTGLDDAELTEAERDIGQNDRDLGEEDDVHRPES